MSIFGAIENSASGLTAQRLRLDIVSNNIANINTTRNGVDSSGNYKPYRRQIASLQPSFSRHSFTNIFNKTMEDNIGDGVQISAVSEDNSPLPVEYDPNSPDAAKIAEPGLPVGYVRRPNVDIVSEMVDMISASRAYEANVTVLNASKSMAMKALEIGRG